MPLYDVDVLDLASVVAGSTADLIDGVMDNVPLLGWNRWSCVTKNNWVGSVAGGGTGGLIAWKLKSRPWIGIVVAPLAGNTAQTAYLESCLAKPAKK